MFEIEDAKEHLEELILEINRNGSIDEIDYRIQIGQDYAHTTKNNFVWRTHEI